MTLPFYPKNNYELSFHLFVHCQLQFEWYINNFKILPEYTEDVQNVYNIQINFVIGNGLYIFIIGK